MDATVRLRVWEIVPVLLVEVILQACAKTKKLTRSRYLGPLFAAFVLISGLRTRRCSVTNCGFPVFHCI